MKTILLISDSHHHPNLVRRLAEEYKNRTDYMIHCGDVCASPETVKDYIVVQGNCDTYGMFEAEHILECEGHRILILHGNSVFSNWAFFSPSAMAQYGARKRCDVVMFGHSHQYYDSETKGVRLLNPGSLIGGHANDFQLASYMIVTIDGKRIEAVKHEDIPFVIG